MTLERDVVAQENAEIVMARENNKRGSAPKNG